MRQGEWRALKRTDFKKVSTPDGPSFLISVNKNLNANGLQLQTKDRRDRLVPLGEEDWLTAKMAITEYGKVYRGMDLNNFRSRHWKKAVEEVTGVYKVPYTMRSTAISKYLNEGGTYTMAARIFGNSAVIIEQRYAGLVGVLKPIS